MPISLSNVHIMTAAQLQREAEYRKLPMPTEGDLDQISLVKLVSDALLEEQKQKDQAHFAKLAQERSELKARLQRKQGTRKAELEESERRRKQQNEEGAAARRRENERVQKNGEELLAQFTGPVADMTAERLSAAPAAGEPDAALEPEPEPEPETETGPGSPLSGLIYPAGA